MNLLSLCLHVISVEHPPPNLGPGNSAKSNKTHKVEKGHFVNPVTLLNKYPALDIAVGNR